MTDIAPGLETKTIRARISGRVQGVWFRGWTAQQADGLGLAGWVRNRRDGTVEALFSGRAEMVDQMLAACRQGPTYARVEDVLVTLEDAYEGKGFRKLETV